MCAGNSEVLEQVDSYQNLGEGLLPTLGESDHIKHICTKLGTLNVKFVGVLYGQFIWGDTNTILHLYLTCMTPS